MNQPIVEREKKKDEMPPPFVIYISTTSDSPGKPRKSVYQPTTKINSTEMNLSRSRSVPGRVYQVDDTGRVLGKVDLPYSPTGMALHRTHGLVLAVPRDGGKIVRIDESGKPETLLEKDPTLVHPVDVAIGGDSDTVVVGDNIADVLAATTTAGAKPKVYQRFEGQKWNAQGMSVAVTNDKHVIFSTDGEPGVYRFAGDEYSAQKKSVLPGYGGVAADPKSTRWAAAQEPNQVFVYDGEELIKKLRLPPNKSLYRHGLLSFSPAGTLCVACRDSDKEVGEPWLLMYDIETDRIRSLFPWNAEEMTDFVVGPRMRWEGNFPSQYKSKY
jgi:hypothetical protein